MSKEKQAGVATAYGWPTTITSNMNANITNVWLSHYTNGVTDYHKFSGKNCLPTAAFPIPGFSGQADFWTISFTDSENNLFSTGFESGPYNGPNDNTALTVTIIEGQGVELQWTSGKNYFIPVNQF